MQPTLVRFIGISKASSTCTRVETGSGYLGQLGHVLFGSSGSDPVYKISKSDPDSTLDRVY